MISCVKRTNAYSSCLTLRDLLYDSIGTLLADIVHNDVGAQLGVHERVGATQAGTGTSDDDRLVVESDGRRRLRVGRQLCRCLKLGLHDVSPEHRQVLMRKHTLMSTSAIVCG